MKYTARVGGREWLIELEPHGDGVRVRVDGVETDAALEGPPGGPLLLREGGRRTPVDVRPDAEARAVTVGAREFRVEVEDERERAAHSVRPSGPAGPRLVRSVMPGIVRQILVSEGDVVDARRPLLVLEAMKMQNEVRAGSDGTVVRIHVAAGTAVARGDALVTLE